MNIKGKNFYFFSDVHENEEGGCSNCSKPNCARIEETFAEYFKKSNSHFFIESEFQNKDQPGKIVKALRPAFLAKTIILFNDCLSNSGDKKLDSLCKQKYPNTFFHYADIRTSLFLLEQPSKLRNYRSEIKLREKEKDYTEVNKLISNSIIVSKDIINTTKKHFQTKEKLKEYVDLFIYTYDFFGGLKKFLKNNSLPFDDMKKVYNYENGPHKISKQIKNENIPDDIKEILKKYYEEEIEKTFNIHYPNYDENIKKLLALETSTDQRLVFNKDLEKFDMLVFEINYLLSNIYALGRMIRFLEDPRDTKDFVLYWGGAHIQHFLQFFSKHYKTSIKPAVIEIKSFRCIKVL